ncbi:MAG: bacterial transcriptional activator domain-containing protein [Lachnospiraceae bacterium]|nr:bacterial transcriptional activator domain-containing protein [Lachnospiraceae bacterium]
MSNEHSGKLVLTMLGDYSLTYEGKPMILGRGKLTKSVQLLQLLLLHLEDGIAKDELVEALYNWEEIGDTNNSLNSMIYRLRNQLIVAGMPKEDYISIKNGICKWEGSVSVEVDVAEFEACVKAASNLTGIEKAEVLERALSIYRGEFLPKLSNELWVTVESVRLKKLYISCVKQLGEIYEKLHEYQKLLGIYRTTATLYPFDEWQEKVLDCLQKMGRFDEAYRVYQDTVRLYSEELGAPPSAKMREQLQKMNGNLLNTENDFLKIQSTLCECEWKNGAYYCAYPSFVDTYRLMCRIIERSGEHMYLMVCTLCYNADLSAGKQDSERVLGNVIERTLRRGDAYTRYSENQFLILLSAVQQEHLEVVFRRIEQGFLQENKNSDCWIEYSVTEIVNSSLIDQLKNI